MKLELFKRNNMTLVGGIVTACREGSGAAEGRVVNVSITGKVWNKEKGVEEDKTLDIAFWNNEERALADRVIKAGVGVGSFITALVVIKEDGKASGLNFKYAGLWHFDEDGEDGEMNIFVGPVASMDEDEENRFVRVSVPVKVSKEETEWHKITFWNSEEAPRGDRAKACLKPRADGTKVHAVIICGKNTKYNEQNTYSGFRFELIPNTK